jgi:hypothetical protein
MSFSYWLVCPETIHNDQQSAQQFPFFRTRQYRSSKEGISSQELLYRPGHKVHQSRFLGVNEKKCF